MDIVYNVLIVLLTLGLVVFACFQYNVQKRAHALNLFNKRWQALKELLEIGRKAENWEHIYPQEHPGIEKNYGTMYNKISQFADECEILFNKDISQTGKEAAESFKSYHLTIDLLENWNKYHEEYPRQYTKEKGKDLFNKQINTSKQLLKLFDDWHNKMLAFIKNNKIN